ncbi:hypothetical protein GCM10027597_09850 [Saccharopolyspora tripterygii]|jgi:hypothetical protein
MVYRMLAAVVEFQRDLIIANIHECLAAPASAADTAAVAT